MPTLHTKPALVVVTLWYFKCQQSIFDEQLNSSKTARMFIKNKGQSVRKLMWIFYSTAYKVAIVKNGKSKNS